MSQTTLDARFALHFASQLPAAFAAARLPPQPDFSHTALTFDGGMLWSAADALGNRAGLDIDAFELRVESPYGTRVVELEGWSLDQARSALSVVTRTPVALLDHALPPHPLSGGATFRRPSSAGRAHWASWFHVARQALSAFATDTAEIRLWPHHFDIAVRLEDDAGHPLGVGFSPGDDGYLHGAFYVTLPHPPSGGEWPTLPAGHWHTEGWNGAVLPIESTPGPDTIQAFLREAIAAARALTPVDSEPVAPAPCLPIGHAAGGGMHAVEAIGEDGLGRQVDHLGLLCAPTCDCWDG